MLLLALLATELDPWHNSALMSYSRFWTWPLLLGFLSCPAFVHAQRVVVSKPVWRTDLRRFGLDPHTWHWSLSAHPTEIQPIGASIAFGLNSHIVAAFMTQKIGGKATLQAVKASRRLHLISLDANSGKVKATRTWPAPSGNLSIGATRNGNFVLLNERRVGVYSADFQELNRFALPVSPPGYMSSWSLLIPPGRDSVFLQLTAFRGANIRWSLRMLSLPELRAVRSWKNLGEIASVSGKYFAKWGADEPLRVSSLQARYSALSLRPAYEKLYIRSLDSEWRAFSAANGCPISWSTKQLLFVGESSFILARCNLVRMSTVDGHVLFAKKFPKGHPISGVWGSSDGRFIAVAEEKMSGVTVETLDMYRRPVPWRVLVYDTKGNKLVCAFRFTWRFACSFSPNGSKLAVLNGGVVKLFDL